MDKSFDENARYEASEVLKPNGELSHENLRDLTDILETDPQFQQMFLNGDSTDQTQALNNVQKLTEQVNNFKLQRKANATLWSKQNVPGKALNVDGYSIGLQDYPEAMEVLGNHNNVDSMGFSTTTDDIGNTVGFDIGFTEKDGSITTSQKARDLTQKFRVDTDSAVKINDLRSLLSKQAKNGTHEDTFDGAQVRRAVKSIVSQGKEISLIYDPLLKSTSLREDLISSGLLSNITYGKLGLSPEQINELDYDGDGVLTEADGLTQADQKMLLDNLFKNPNLSRQRQELITDYYTQLVKQEWDAQHQVHVSNYNKSLAQNTAATNLQRPTINGGQVNTQGVYVPNKQ
jgi:hypothetical protein